MSGSQFQMGDRVLVTGGYDADPEWLQGGAGYRGRIVEILGDGAVVELDDRLTLTSRRGWEDFGTGAPRAVRTLPIAHGRWLVLLRA